MNKMRLMLAVSIVSLGGLGSMAQATGFAKDAYLEFEQAEQVLYTISDSNPYSADRSQS